MSEFDTGGLKSRYLETKKQETKAKIGEAFEAYKSLLKDKIHPDNQTEGYKKNIASALNRLLVAADEMDSVNAGEGIFGLLVLSLRSILKVKDEVTRLEVDIREIRREIKRLKKQQ